MVCSGTGVWLDAELMIDRNTHQTCGGEVLCHHSIPLWVGVNILEVDYIQELTIQVQLIRCI